MSERTSLSPKPPSPKGVHYGGSGSNIPLLSFGVRQRELPLKRPQLYYETAYDWRSDEPDSSFVTIDPPIRAAFFDFDGTITTGIILSVDMNGAMRKEDYIGAMGGQDRLSLLREMFATLRERNVALYILSNGPTETIRDALRATDLYDYFGTDGDGVYGRERRGGTKDAAIDTILLAAGIPPFKALLVDEDHVSIDHVKSGRSAGVLASKRGGMQGEEMEHILDLSVAR